MNPKKAFIHGKRERQFYGLYSCILFVQLKEEEKNFCFYISSYTFNLNIFIWQDSSNKKNNEDLMDSSNKKNNEDLMDSSNKKNNEDLMDSSNKKSRHKSNGKFSCIINPSIRWNSQNYLLLIIVEESRLI
jgi:hypothetical protein